MNLKKPKMPRKAFFAFLTLFMITIATALFADDSVSKIDSGDTAWMLISSALVLLMIPGLALFYGGMVRSKNILNTIILSLIALGVITLQWVFFGYSLSFGKDIGHLIGWTNDYFLLLGVKPEDVKDTIPLYVFIAFQGMFAVITPALISGAIAERMKYSAYIIFIILWSTLVYDPICHWVWGDGGWIANLGAKDFAGGTVVHINAGIAALAAVLILRKRKGYPGGSFIPNNLNFTLLGAGLLWFGWFGFNAGSAVQANASAGLAFITTFVATAGGAVAWSLAEYWHRGKSSALGVASGIVAGLVAITPAAGFVEPVWAIVIGLIAGFVCYGAVVMKGRLGYDDALDVFGIHGVGGIWGAVATGIFATVGATGLIGGDAGLVWKQMLAVLGTMVYAFIMTWIIIKILDLVMGIRVSEEDEDAGLDQAAHGETGYNI